MNRNGAILILCTCLAATAAPLSPSLRRLPLYFEPAGTAEAGFVSHGPGRFLEVSSLGSRLILGQRGRHSTTLTMKLAGGNPRAATNALEPQTGTVSHIEGNDRSLWRSAVRTYGRVTFSGVYSGIDLTYYGNEGQLEYDFEVSPGADPNSIRMAYTGASRMAVAEDGTLILATEAGEIRQRKPSVYQEIDGIRREVPGRYVIRGSREVGFRVGPYDHTRKLVIDPVLTYATYFGGANADSAYGIATDATGNVYIAGETLSSNLPASKTAVQQSLAGGSDLYVTKLGPKGEMVFTTYLGGKGTEIMAGMAMDSAGNIYVAGTTDSTNFPTTAGAVQAANRGGSYFGVDGFVAKLDPSGSTLLYGTYLGGNDDDLLYAIAVDSSGNAYVTGFTASLNFPVTSGAYQKTNKFLNSFVSKISTQGTQLLYSTLVGGSQVDVPYCIAVDAAGSAYVAGNTTSTDFPTLPATVAQRGLSDVFVFSLNSQGSQLRYSTLAGGSGDESAMAVTLDAAGNAYVAGYTNSTNFPVTPGVLQSSLSGIDDGIVLKITPSGILGFATLLGGTRSDRAVGIAVDAAGSIYVGGSTASSNFPVLGAFQSSLGGGSDAFVVKLNSTATKVVQGTYLGGSDDDTLLVITIDRTNNVYVAGNTLSTNFPTTTGVAQTRFGGGGEDAFVAKINFDEQNLNLAVAPSTLTFQGNTGVTLAHQALSVTEASGASVPWTVSVQASGGAWLKASPASGAASGTIDVSVDTVGLTAGTYSGSVTVTNTVTGAASAVSVSLVLATAVDPGGQVPAAGVVSAASFQGGPVAPGEMVTIFGTGIGPATLTQAALTADGLSVSKTLAETQVLFDGVAAPLIYVSATQVSALVPYAVSNKSTTTLQIVYKGLKSNALPLPVGSCAPAIFTANASGAGQASLANQDYSLNGANNPAEKGSVVTFYATGEGQTDPAGVDGLLALSAYPKPLLPVSVKIGGADAPVLYYGAAPGAVAGVLQVNVKVPDGAVAGDQSLVLGVGNCSSRQGVTIAIR